MKVLEPYNLRWEMLDKGDIVDSDPNTITFEEYEQTERDNFEPEDRESDDRHLWLYLPGLNTGPNVLPSEQEEVTGTDEWKLRVEALERKLIDDPGWSAFEQERSGEVYGSLAEMGIYVINCDSQVLGQASILEKGGRWGPEWVGPTSWSPFEYLATLVPREDVEGCRPPGGLRWEDGPSPFRNYLHDDYDNLHKIRVGKDADPHGTHGQCYGEGELEKFLIRKVDIGGIKYYILYDAPEGKFIMAIDKDESVAGEEGEGGDWLENEFSRVDYECSVNTLIEHITSLIQSGLWEKYPITREMLEKGHIMGIIRKTMVRFKENKLGNWKNVRDTVRKLLDVGRLKLDWPKKRSRHARAGENNNNCRATRKKTRKKKKTKKTRKKRKRKKKRRRKRTRKMSYYNSVGPMT